MTPDFTAPGGADQRFELQPALRKVPVHVPARAGRREQHRLARIRRHADGLVEGRDPDDLGHARRGAEGGLDGRGRLPHQDGGPHRLPGDGAGQGPPRRFIVESAEDEDEGAGQVSSAAMVASASVAFESL
jgi:hypothetical protein